MATAPDAIWRLWHDIENKCPRSMGAVLAGIVGDVNHSFGFHLAPNELPASDYSLQTARDKAGAKAYPGCASALDVHFNADGMILATKRLIASAKDPDDHRLDGLFEFCGTTTGTHPHPYTVDTGTDDPNNTQGWDDSHNSHVHLSIHRDVCTNYDAIKGIADVLAGIPLGLSLEDIVALDRDSADYKHLVQDIADAVWAKKLKADDGTGGDNGIAASRFLTNDYVLDRKDAAQDAKP